MVAAFWRVRGTESLDPNYFCALEGGYEAVVGDGIN
jgi:hypothetical protein